MEITVERLGHRGDGLAEGHRVPFTLPGERVRLEPLTILSPSPERVEAPCPVFTRCGGCAVQHASDRFVTQWKEDQVRRALTAHGLDFPFRSSVTSPPASRRRASLHVRRTRKTVEIGFLQRGSHGLVPIRDCGVLAPGLSDALEVLARLGAHGASRQGLARLDVTVSEAGLDVVLTPAKPLEPKAQADLVACAVSMDLARLSLGDDVLLMARPPSLRMDGIVVVPPPGAFLQATPHGEAALRADVQEAVGSAARIADLFSGCGTFALPLARQAQVLAVESEPALLEALDTAWRATPGLKRVVTRQRDLFRRPLLPNELKGVEAVVIDPPRAGAEAQMRALAESDVPVIAAVSCNPTSFARDA
ncbi:MAG: class I SAM-dependent RNA methyltransferase, partial [Pseudomonadota bacterium]